MQISLTASNRKVIRSQSVLNRGMQTKGRPKRTWIEIIKKDMLIVNVTEMALNTAERKDSRV